MQLCEGEIRRRNRRMIMTNKMKKYKESNIKMK